MVIGTTGLDDEQFSTVKAASQNNAYLYGLQLRHRRQPVFKLAEMAAAVLGDDADIEIH